MGVFTRADSPFFWLRLERPGARALRESTKIPTRGATADQTRELRQLAEATYHLRMGELARTRQAIPDPRASTSFGAFLDWYLRHVSAHKRGARREGEIAKVLRAAFGAADLRELTADRVREWMTSRARAVSGRTVNRELDLLKHVLGQAVPKYLPVSPVAKLPRLRQPATEPTILTRDEEHRLLQVLRLDDYALVLLALDGLLRLSDCLNLQRRHDHGDYLTVVDSKTGQYRVPVSARLRQALDALPGETPYYFAARRRARDPRDYGSSVRQMLERACRAAGVRYGRRQESLTFHLLRHTGASRMVEAGTDLRTVQALGGWKSLRQLTRYAHPTDAAKRAAVEAVGARAPHVHAAGLEQARAGHGRREKREGGNKG